MQTYIGVVAAMGGRALREDDKVALIQVAFFIAVFVLIAWFISGCTINIRHQYEPPPVPSPIPGLLERMDYAGLSE